jgi:hypothetical protein
MRGQQIGRSEGPPAWEFVVASQLNSWASGALTTVSQEDVPIR